MNSPENSLQDVVIGAGITGLAYALALAQAGRRPVIIDPAEPGGVMRSVLERGFTLECGPNTLVRTAEMVRLLQWTGLEDRIRTPSIPRYRQYVWYRDAVRRVPSSPLALLRSPLFPAFEKFRALRGMFRSLSLRTDRTCSVNDLFSELFSPHIASNLAAPVLRGIFGGDISKLAASEIFPALWEHLEKRGTLVGYLRRRAAQGKRSIFCVEGGNAAITSSAVRALEGRGEFIRSEVSAVSPGFGRDFTVTLSSGQRIAARTVAIATSGASSANYLSTLAPELGALLAAVRYAPVVVVHLSIPAESKLPERGFGVLFPPESGEVMGILFNSQLFPHVAPPGKGLITVCFGGVQYPEVIEYSDDALAARAVAAATRYLGVSDASALRCTKWRRGIPQYELGIDAVHRKMREVEEKFPGLRFIGADRGGIGVPARVETAFAAATSP